MSLSASHSPTILVVGLAITLVGFAWCLFYPKPARRTGILIGLGVVALLLLVAIFQTFILRR